MRFRIWVLLSLVGAAMSVGARRRREAMRAANTQGSAGSVAHDSIPAAATAAMPDKSGKDAQGPAPHDGWSIWDEPPQTTKTKSRSGADHVCECFYCFPTKETAVQHASHFGHTLLRDKHNWVYYCQECKMEYASANTLNVHFRTEGHKRRINGGYDMKKHFACAQCSQSANDLKCFKSEREAAQHLAMNSDHHVFLKSSVTQNSQWRCNECQRSFKYDYTLNT
eukprot:Platyproteum_vivax@DN12621_c0_g1_i1.p1